MESSSSSSTSSNQNREEEEEIEERHPLLLSPCHFLEQLIASCLKCLGLDYHYRYFSPSSGADERSTSTEAEDRYEEQTEMEMKLGEEGVMMATETSTRALRVKRKVGSGSGPKITVASS